MLLIRLFRKMVNNRWMVFSLLIGFVLSIAMISSIPAYTDGALQRMLTRDLENFQLTAKRFPGIYNVAKAAPISADKEWAIDYYNTVDKKISEELIPEIKLPLISRTSVIINNLLYAVPAREDEPDAKGIQVKVEAMLNINDHVKMIDGQLFSSKKAADGAYEVIVNEDAAKNLDVVTGKDYLVYKGMDGKATPVKVRVTGIYSIKDDRDPYWCDNMGGLSNSLLMDYQLFKDDFLKSDVSSISNMEWHYAFDYHNININNISDVVSVIKSHDEWFTKEGEAKFDMPVLSILEKYSTRAKQLKITLWVLNVPIIILLIFYLFMVSRLTIEHEEGEIAVLKSRGAGSGQIFKGYLLESIVLGITAIAIGPFLGLFMCRVLGISNGFMDFVNRPAIPIKISPAVYEYSMLGVIIFMVAMLAPVIPASRKTIVLYRQEKSRKQKRAFWRRYFIDVLLILISGYGYYSYQTRQNILKVTGALGNEIPIDPFLFLVTMFFIFGVGLLFLRLFPYIVRFVFSAGKKVWTPTAYASLINVGRSPGKYSFLMLFLILTISLGIFDANAARTINNNSEEREKYVTGADITMKPVWQSNKINQGRTSASPQSVSSQEDDSDLLYVEPPFSQYEELSGVQSAAKVLRRKDVFVKYGEQTVAKTYLMGIVPEEFGKTAWFRPNLLKHHWYQYLNILSQYPSGILVSKSFETKYKAKVGDSVSMKWGKNDYFEGIICGFVDYWPTFNPYEKNEYNKTIDLIVANLPYIQVQMPTEPYEVWIKKAPGVTSKQLYDDIKSKKIEIKEMNDTSQLITAKKNDPMLQGTNGALTLGFIITMIISIIGFLIYWIFSIKSRMLQFGVIRAMGVSFREIVLMLIGEQLLISGTSIIMGIIIGGMASDLFVPLLQISYSSAEQILPFSVVSSGSDYLKIYIIVAVMFAAGVISLARIIRRINVGEVLKLGED